MSFSGRCSSYDSSCRADGFYSGGLNITVTQGSGCSDVYNFNKDPPEFIGTVCPDQNNTPASSSSGPTGRTDGKDKDGNSYENTAQSYGSSYASGQGSNAPSFKKKNVDTIDPSTLQGLHETTQELAKANQLFSQSVQSFSQSTQTLANTINSFQATTQQFQEFLTLNNDRLKSALEKKLNRNQLIPDTWLTTEKQIVDEMKMNAHLLSAPSRLLGAAIAQLCTANSTTQKACEIFGQGMSEIFDFVVPQETQKRLDDMRQDLMTKWQRAYGYSLDDTAQFVQSVDILAANVGTGVIGGGIKIGAQSLIAKLKALPKSGFTHLPITINDRLGSLVYTYENHGAHLNIFVSYLEALDGIPGPTTKSTGFVFHASKEITKFANQQNATNAYLQFIPANKRLFEIIGKRLEYLGEYPLGMKRGNKIPSLAGYERTLMCPTFKIPLELPAIQSSGILTNTMPGSLLAFPQEKNAN